MLGKIIIFVFCFLGIFTLLFYGIPSGFMVTTPTKITQQIDSQFNPSQLIGVYNNNVDENMTWEYSSLQDTPPKWTGGDLPSGMYLEVNWGKQVYFDTAAESNVRIYLCTQTILGVWVQGDTATFTYQNLTSTPDPISISEYDAIHAENASTHIATFLFNTHTAIGQIQLCGRNSSEPITPQWAAGNMAYCVSFNVNQSAVPNSMNAFSLISKLLTFQMPDLGVGDYTTNFILNNLIAIPVWAMIIYAAYKVIAGLIPWVSGGSGD